MPSTFTQNTGIELIADGEQTGLWGQTTNTNFDIVDRALNGVGFVSLSGTTSYTLTTPSGTFSDTEFGQYAVLVFSGSPGGTATVTIEPATAQKTYSVRNQTDQTVVFTQGSGGNVTVPAGRSAAVYADGGGATAAVVDISAGLVPVLTNAGVTATAAELNILDGVTATTAELNVLDGVDTTLTPDFLANPTNYLDPDNRIINGAFDFWQRGTSGTSGGFVAADRWQQFVEGGTVTQSRQSHTVGDKFGSNTPQFYLRQTVSGQSAAGHLAVTAQTVEGVRSYGNETITVLGWARRSSGIGNMVLEGFQTFGTGGSPSANVDAISPTTITLTADWEPFAAVLTVPSIAGKTLGTDGNDRLGLNFFTSAGSDLNARTNSLGIQTIGVDLWGIHIKRGTHTADATEAYRAPELGPELARCQRYFQVAIQGVSGNAISTQTAYLNYQPSVEFRVTPTLSLTAPAKIDWPDNANYTQSAASIQSTFSDAKGGIGLRLPNFSGLTVHSALTLRNDGGRILLDAEI